MKIYIIHENCWIVGRLINEFRLYNKNIITNNIKKATIIWLVNSNIYQQLKKFSKLIKKKNIKVITTVHHTVPNKMLLHRFIKRFNYLNTITTVYHSICDLTTKQLSLYTKKPIITIPFWCNMKLWKPLTISKNNLKEMFNIPYDKFIIGTFQKDTEKNGIKIQQYKPKLEKGPDILVNIYDDINKTKNNLLIITTGYNRHYIIQEMKKKNINYLELGMVDIDKLNYLMRSIDLYIVAARYEGGPRSIYEASLCKTPLISTNVGIASDILHPDSIFDVNNYMSYKNATPNIEYAYNNAIKYDIDSYYKQFNNLFN